MRLFTVHFRGSEDAPDGDLEVVREGFRFWAFLFTVLWALWNRLWLVALGLFAVQSLASALAQFAGAGTAVDAAITLGVAVLFGLLAADLKRWTLARRGYAMVSVVGADDDMGAELRFLDLNPWFTKGVRP